MQAPAIDRLEYLVRGSVDVLEAESPYVTLLLRVRGNTDVERAALDRRRTFDRFVAELVAEAVRDGDIRPEADAMITARLLFGLVNSIVEWYRPGRSAGAASLADAVCAMAFDGLRARRRPSRLVADRDLAALTVPLRAAGDDHGLAGGDAPRAPGHGRRVQRVGDRCPRHRGDHDAGRRSSARRWSRPSPVCLLCTSGAPAMAPKASSGCTSYSGWPQVSRYWPASISLARRPQAWMLKPWPVSSRQRWLAAW